jgi:RimJ/RimL family protein N-acetyltransferase
MSFIRWLWSDPETMEPVGGPVHLTEGQARRWFAAVVDPGSPSDCYRLILDEDGHRVGEVSYHRLDVAAMTAEFNIKVVSTARGRGYAREAMLLFLDYFFNDLGGRVMVDDVALDNGAGQQALLRFGFERMASPEGVFRLWMTREAFHSRYGAEGGAVVPERAD